MRLVGAGSELLARAAPADELGGCCGRLGRVAACMTSLHHSWLALEPSMALGSFSLSLLIQVHEAAAVVASGGDAGDDDDTEQQQRRDTTSGKTPRLGHVDTSGTPVPGRSQASRGWRGEDGDHV